MAETLRDRRKQPGSAATTQKARRIDVHDLLAGGREVVLLHSNEEYRLRLTSNGKLILTK